jgi:hypothetical protein
VSRDGLIGSLVTLNALPVVLALGLYLGFTRTLGLRRYLRGLAAGLLVMAIGMRVWVPDYWFWPTEAAYLIAALPLFFGLLASMWVARPIYDGRRVAKISA